MDRRTFLGAGAALTIAAAVSSAVPAAAAEKEQGAARAECGSIARGDGKVVGLPNLDKKGGKPLMDCLALRRSTHAPGSNAPSMEQLGALLYSAAGISSEDGKLVVPTAMNRRKVQLFAVLEDGVWEYLPKEHAIKRVLMGDHRASFDKSGCILLYGAPVSERFSAMHVGSMYQNAGLCCASLGLKNCVKFQKCQSLDKELPYAEGWETFISQSVSA